MRKNDGAKNPRYIRRGPDGEKRCSKCGDWKKLDEFPVDRSRYDKHGYVCFPCRNKPATSRPNLRDRRLMHKKGYAWCRECRSWLEINSVRTGLCRAHANEDARKRYASNDGYRFRRIQHARSRKRSIEPIPFEGAKSILEEFDGLCAYCGNPADSWDHVVPISEGGRTEPSNVVPACISCNSKKRNMNVWEFLRKYDLRPPEEFFNRISLAYVWYSVGPNAMDDI